MKDSSPDIRPSATPGIRWLLLAILSGLAAAAWVAVQMIPHVSAQQKWTREAAVLLGASIALGLWFFIFSRIPGRIRLWSGVALAVLGAGFAATFKYDGVSGDLRPRFRWRWSIRSVPALNSQLATGPALTTTPGAADFPQFLGPTRDCRISGPALAVDWSHSPPKEMWRIDVGKGWSGFAVSGSYAVTQEQRGETELVTCYELATGKLVWSRADAGGYMDPQGIAGIGPRATPTLHEGRVYAQGGSGILNCLDLMSGELLWTKDLTKECEAEMPDYGFCASPLIDGESVIVAPGAGAKSATLAAFHTVTGEKLWQGGKQSASYSSPVILTLCGVRQIVHLGTGSVAGYDIATGAKLWLYEWKREMRHPHAANPIQLAPDIVHVSAGYGKGSAAVKISKDAAGKWSAEEHWETNRMKAKFSTLIFISGCIYGLDDGVFASQDAETGDLNWRDGSYGHGQILLTKQGRLLVMAEDGAVVLIDPDPQGLKEVARFDVLSGKTWNPPALAGEYLVVRNASEAACFRLPVVPGTIPPS